MFVYPSNFGIKSELIRLVTCYLKAAINEKYDVIREMRTII